jgi:hypothetical protein
MRIGVDFDNTIACYDGVFHAIAVERGLIPASVATDKTSVRDYLRAQGQDPVFTELQGQVYGPGMVHVRPYPGVAETLRAFLADGHTLCLISHKTRTPFAGPPYDLHDWAWRFLRAQSLVDAPGAPFAAGEVFFELTKDAKIARIASERCEMFIDDLPEILAFPGFPASARSILFDPDGNYPDGMWRGRRFERCTDWPAIRCLAS